MKKHQQMFAPDFFKGICHRGLHDDERTENGLRAFKNALDHDFAFELDIHLTKDGELIVCHDSELERTTGKKGIIEHLTLKEIKENYRLLDGEEVPTFQEVLDLNNEQHTIVVELKCYEKNYKALAAKAKEALKQIKDKTKIVVISFDPRALLHMKGAGFARELLVWKKKDWVYHFRGFFESLDIDEVMLEEKRVRRYAKKHILNVWTINTEDKLNKAVNLSDGFTWELLNPEHVKNLQKTVKASLKS